ncbi:hypothetical protein [Pleomorphomonas sp. JP5]|uniref:hypothetical protein n=1 Tax=Pleomorphomonas sp. JP5 TaxID=2942998 RepID=UPI0020433E18|nr:hypothetical protein [Pleomorphomonas sp. JP5]MCM5558497.1 hypothetical protein [Pleomorphomonas sp. JP5]
MTTQPDFYIVKDGRPQNYFSNGDAAQAELDRLKTDPETATEYVSAIAIPCDEFFALREAEYLERPPVEITEERYDDLLNVMPPVHWRTADGVERFLLCEAETGRIHLACAKRNGRFLTVFVRRGDLSTYPTAATFDALPVEA